MEGELIGGWVVSLSILAFLYWRSSRNARLDSRAETLRERAALETRLTDELKTVKDRADLIESKLQTQLTDLESQLQTSEVNKAKLEQEISVLMQQCQRLREDLKTQSIQAQTDAIAGGFDRIQPLLTQYPSVKKMIESQPDLPARNIVALLTSLENLVKFWECEPIGKPWEMVPYDAQIHQAEVGDIQAGESVCVRFIGYRQGDRILVPAKVSRTLPTGVKT
jgi:molecular chaperone GrpE (heat shock protein)